VTLELRNIVKSFGGVEVLHSVSMTGRAGEVLAVVGANGAGKSTLIKILSGSQSKDSGHLLLDEQEMDLRSPQDAMDQGIRTVYQELVLVPELSVTENLLMGAFPRRAGLIDWTAAHARTQELLDSIGFGGIDPKAQARSLSVARQQMVEIAKALVNRPRILILDEPSSVLAGSDLDSLFDLIRRLRDDGVLVIYISHRLAEVLDLADEIVVMKDGRVIATTSPTATDQDELIRMMAGRRIDQIYPDRREGAGEPMLSVVGLSRPGEFEDVSLTVRAGEVLGVFGLVGSGRSELVECIFGARPAASGTVSVASSARAPHSPKQAIAAGMVLVTEDRGRTGLVLKMNVQDNVALATMQGPIIKVSRQRERVASQISQLDIRPENCASMPVWQLSGGNQQKVVLAKWLLTEPRVLILDEPTRGVDMATRVDIYRMIDELARAGLCVLLVSSDLTEVIGATDRVLVMREGRLVSELLSASTTEDEVLAKSIGTTR